VTIPQPTPRAIRVLEHFTYERRRDGICAAVEAALRDHRSAS
jgi:hypothetical protein